ncbi:MAG: hypothetical protein ACR2N7_03375 [Acidimicrobiia bacterium]
MKKLLIAPIALALLLAACSGDSGAQVASLDDAPLVESGSSEPQNAEVNDQEAILAFAQCMRDNGIDDFEDPDLGDDGSIGFSFRGGGAATDIDRETMQSAFEACRENLEGLSLGPGSVDRSEIEDTLYEFAACMRENGIDMPDPDLSAFGPGQGEQGQGDPNASGPFGGSIDPDDPAFQEALEACEGVFAGGFRFGGPGGNARRSS